MQILIEPQEGNALDADREISGVGALPFIREASRGVHQIAAARTDRRRDGDVFPFHQAPPPVAIGAGVPIATGSTAKRAQIARALS